MLKVLPNQGIIPWQLSRCPVPKCPGCIYGKIHCQPWCSKAPPNKIKPATQPGAVVSVDQFISTTVGLNPQGWGTLTTCHYTGTTIFVDHVSDLMYAHLMESLNGDETLQAKYPFEAFARTHSVTIKHYHCDNEMQVSWCIWTTRSNYFLLYC